MAMRSSNVLGCSSRRYFCIPGDSNWNVPIVLPLQYSSYVFGSSIGIESMSTSILRLWRIFSNASFITESVLSPKKSIFMRPVSSMTLPSYWVTSIFSPVSLSSAMLIGTGSVMSSRQMIVPQACTPVLRTLPSSIFAYLIVSRRVGSGDASASRSSGTACMALGKFILRPSGRRSGMALQSLFDVSSGSF